MSSKSTCSRCSQPLEPTRIGKQRYCKSCHAKHMRDNRPKHSQLSDEQRLKAIARSYLHVYVKRGKVRHLPCSVCNTFPSEAHHPDYTKPLEVIWYCREHHLALS